MLWQTTTDCSINRFQGHHCYYKPCSLIYNNTNMFYKRAVQCSGKINHSLLTHSWLSTALSPVVNWIPSNFVLLTFKSTRYRLEEGRERKESSPGKGIYPCHPGSEIQMAAQSPPSTIVYFSVVCLLLTPPQPISSMLPQEPFRDRVSFWKSFTLNP